MKKKIITVCTKYCRRVTLNPQKSKQLEIIHQGLTMVNNVNSWFREGLPSFCTSTMTSYMQVGYRNVDPSVPYKDGIRKKTCDEIVRRIF